MASRATVEISTSLMRDASGEPVGFRGVARDVTERKRVEADLQKSKEAAEAANRAKSEFLANMSHELRTPLNHIMGFTELVVTKSFGELNEIQEEYLNDVLMSSNHLLSLIDDILDISKIEEGRMEIKLSDVDVSRTRGEKPSHDQGKGPEARPALVRRYGCGHSGHPGG